MTISDILWGILAPALLAGVFFFWPAAVFTSRTSLPGALARILGIGAPLLLVFVHFFDWPSYPPKASLDRFFYAVIATMMLSFIHAALKDRPKARPLMPMLFASSIGVPLLILWSQLSFSTQAAGALSTTASWCWVFGVGLAIGVLAIAMDHLAERAPGAGIPLTWWAARR